MCSYRIVLKKGEKVCNYDRKKWKMLVYYTNIFHFNFGREIFSNEITVAFIKFIILY